jgi:hypothetical protein
MTKICTCGHKKSDHARWVNDNQCLKCQKKQPPCLIPFYDLVWLKFSSRTPMANGCMSECK